MKLAVAVPEAAEMIGISESMLWELLASGDIAKVKVGRRTLIRVAELEHFLAAGEQTVPAAGEVHLTGSGRGRRRAGDGEAPPDVVDVPRPNVPREGEQRDST